MTDLTAAGRAKEPVSAPVVKYYRERKISAWDYVKLPVEMLRPEGRYGNRVSMTVLADGTVVIGHPDLIPDLPDFKWMNVSDRMYPSVIEPPEKIHCPEREYVLSPEPEESDPYIFDEEPDEGEQIVFFGDDEFPQDQRGKNTENEEKEKKGEQPMNGNSTDGNANAALMRMAASSIQNAVEALEKCIRDLNRIAEAFAQAGD